MPDLRAAAALEQIGDSASEALSPAEVDSPPVSAPALDESAAPDPALLAPPAQPTAAQPAAAVEPVLAAEHPKLPLPVPLLAASAQPALAQPAAPAKPDVPFQPSRVQFLSPPSPKAALPVLLSQAALPQATPAAQASIHSHGSFAKEGSICNSSEDKVVSNGCWGTFCCFKADRRGRCGIFSRREH